VTNYNNLPRLPIPALDDTIERYLRSIQPLGTDPAELATHTALVRDFQATTGPKLHEELVALDAASAASGGFPFSYIESQWDDMYYGGRWAIPINSNAFYLLNDTPNQEQISRSAQFVASSLKWIAKLNGGELEADKVATAGKPPPLRRAQPARRVLHSFVLRVGVHGSRDPSPPCPPPVASSPDCTAQPNPGCMSQYPTQFGTGRRAGEGRCTLVTDHAAGHIVVLRDDCFYKVAVTTDGGATHLSVAAIEAQLRAIADQASAPCAKTGVGILGAGERDRWAAQRLELETLSQTNRDSLHAIDTALLVLVLERSEGAGGEGAGPSLEQSRQLLHGGDSGKGRWWDKHNVIAFADGSMGINFEHSHSDGMTWNR
jgi:hypothetical protein